MERAEAEIVARSAVAALQRGDGPAARSGFERVLQAGHESLPLRLMLAQACRLCGDAGGEAEALDRVLAADPANLTALLMRADGYAAARDPRAAVSFYKAALAAARRLRQPPPGLGPDLQRAERYVAQAGSLYEEWLLRSLADAGLGPERGGPRFAEALDIMLGRRQVQLQQPSAFYFPGLPQTPFYEREQFAWAPDLEAAAPEIADELAQLLGEGADFRPYVEAEKDRPKRDFHGMQGDPSWGAFYLWDDGRPIEEHAARCPRTVEALSKVPMTRIGGRTPAVLFSLLKPGAHIPPHRGMLNCRLICHLPLIVPPGCWLRVGNETRSCEEGKLLVFDDSFEHEAKNGSAETRVILLFDVWKPELDDAERLAISAMFAAIDAFGTGGGNA